MQALEFGAPSQMYNSTRVNRHLDAARSYLMCLVFRSRWHEKRPHLSKWLDFSGASIDKQGPFGANITTDRIMWTSSG